MLRMIGSISAVAVAISAVAASPALSAEPDVVYPSVTVSVDQKELDAPGILVRGHSLVPVRGLVERLNGKVMFHSPSKTLWAAFPDQGQTVRMKIGEPEATVHAYDGNDSQRAGKQIGALQLKRPPMLLGGHVLAPVGAVAEVAEAKVFFKPETKHVSVESQPAAQTAGG